MASNYPVSFRFQLSFKGEDAAFQEVSGISKEMSVEEVVSGGENRFKYRLPTVSSTQNLVLKRAMVPKGSKLIKWVSDSVFAGLAKPIQTKDVLVSLLDEKGKTCVKWTFHKAYPVKYSVSDLKSDGNDLAIESIELAYTFFELS
ncbi:phage tail protein [Reichenbachiella sp.]|uniref:phage tail protein n=1 Tax=Reichenbachiella sp. TaxID=2184521 RepID=UPI003BB1B8F1